MYIDIIKRFDLNVLAFFGKRETFRDMFDARARGSELRQDPQISTKKISCVIFDRLHIAMNRCSGEIAADNFRGKISVKVELYLLSVTSVPLFTSPQQSQVYRNAKVGSFFE